MRKDQDRFCKLFIDFEGLPTLSVRKIPIQLEKQFMIPQFITTEKANAFLLG